jgi:hypothetical protein
MTPVADENGTKPSDTDKAESTGNETGCGPGCNCGQPVDKSNSKLKMAFFGVLVVAVCGILIYKTTSAKQTPASTGTTGFATSLATPGKGAVSNSAGQQGGSGASLSGIADLNKVASNLDTVFIIIPSQNNASITKESSVVLASVERTLNAKGLSTGIYTLQTASPDYPDIVAKVTPPGIAVLTKGRGTVFITGDISETNLMQAYVASTRQGGCCPPPSDGKTAVPCK